MKYIKVLILFLVIYLQYGFSTAYAITPNPTILPAFLNRQAGCGYAEDLKANKCCPKINFEVLVGVPARLVLRQAFPDLIADGAVNALSKAYEYEPLHKVTEVSCYSGIEKKTSVKNPTTGQIEESCICSDEDYQEKPFSIFGAKETQIEKICSTYITNSKEKKACIECGKRDALLTGLGCIPTNFSGFISDFLLKVGIGFAGMFSLGCIIYSAIMIQVSQGNAEKISQSQDQIKACIFGLLIVMFSILLLRIIGVNILSIPGFG